MQVKVWWHGPSFTEAVYIVQMSSNKQEYGANSSVFPHKKELVCLNHPLLFPNQPYIIKEIYFHFW
jgi:hypothetical protein